MNKFLLAVLLAVVLSLCVGCSDSSDDKSLALEDVTWQIQTLYDSEDDETRDFSKPSLFKDFLGIEQDPDGDAFEEKLLIHAYCVFSKGKCGMAAQYNLIDGGETQTLEKELKKIYPFWGKLCTTSKVVDYTADASNITLDIEKDTPCEFPKKMTYEIKDGVLILTAINDEGREVYTCKTNSKVSTDSVLKAVFVDED